LLTSNGKPTDDGWKMKARDCIDLLASIKDDEVRERMINSHHKGLLSDMYILEKFSIVKNLLK